MQPIAPPLLDWFYKNQRSLPFRTQPSPYRVWVSEIMLQQTRVAAALPYYERFMAELPTVADLAACPKLMDAMAPAVYSPTPGRDFSAS